MKKAIIIIVILVMLIPVAFFVGLGNAQDNYEWNESGFRLVIQIEAV
jgi:hypothetical protein